MNKDEGRSIPGGNHRTGHARLARPRGRASADGPSCGSLAGATWAASPWSRTSFEGLLNGLEGLLPDQSSSHLPDYGEIAVSAWLRMS